MKNKADEYIANEGLKLAAKLRKFNPVQGCEPNCMLGCIPPGEYCSSKKEISLREKIEIILTRPSDGEMIGIGDITDELLSLFESTMNDVITRAVRNGCRTQLREELKKSLEV